MPDYIYMAGTAFPVENLGPGRRLVVWVEGCTLACSGCMTPELFKRRHRYSVSAVADSLLPYLRTEPRLTISGGEPFQQSVALAKLLKCLREHVDVEVLIYSGYTIEELKTNQLHRVLLNECDLLIDGRFVASQGNQLQWRGSDNQVVHLLTPRSLTHKEHADAHFTEPRLLHIQQLAGGLRLIGIPRREDVNSLSGLLADGGINAHKGTLT